jgi:hypothetical protein
MSSCNFHYFHLGFEIWNQRHVFYGQDFRFEGGCTVGKKKREISEEK